VELLTQLKDFARAGREHDTLLPKEVATLLYFAAISLALVRRQQRITSLSDEQLRVGIEWGLSQSWVTDSVRQILRQAEESLRQSGLPGR
jgi:hypothetical protein